MKSQPMDAEYPALRPMPAKASGKRKISDDTMKRGEMVSYIRFLHGKSGAALRICSVAPDLMYGVPMAWRGGHCAGKIQAGSVIAKGAIVKSM